MNQVERPGRQARVERVRLDEVDVGQTLSHGHPARRVQLLRADIHGNNRPRRARPAAQRTDDAHRPAAKIEAAPPRLHADLIEHYLGFGLPDPRP